MQLPFSLAGAIAAAAQEQNLGARKAAYRRVRRLAAWAIWMLAIVVVFVALTFGLAEFQYVPAQALLVAFLAGILIYRYAVPRHLVMLYEHGLVHARGSEVRAVRWEEIPFLWHGPGVLTLWLGGRDGQVVIRRFARQQDLAAALDAELQPRALARAEAQLRETGQAAFPPLTVTGEGLQFVGQSNGPQSVPWSQVAAYERVGGRLIIDLAQSAVPASAVPASAVSPTAWFDASTANVIAAERLMDQTDPTTPPVRAAAQVAADVGAGQAWARAKGRRTRVQAAVQGTLVTVVILGGLAILNGQSSHLDAVCHGQAAAGTASYSGGPGQHPVDVEGDDGFTSAEVLPPDLVPARRADVQLVACVTSVQTPSVATTCQYTGATGTMYWENYTITLYAASTGRRLTGPVTVQGGNITCPDSTLVGQDQTAITQHSLLDDSQLLHAISRYAG